MQLIKNLFSQKNKYNFNLLFVKSDSENYLWKKENWENEIEEILTNLFINSKNIKRAGIKALQYERYFDTNFYRPIKLGKLNWNKLSNRKWSVSDSEKKYFKSLEVCIPSLSICEKQSIYPDIYFHLNNESNFQNNKINQFDTFIVIAIAKNLKMDWKSSIIGILQKVNAIKTVSCERTWEKGKNDYNRTWTLNNSIQDTFTNGIYKQQNIHNFKFEDILFEPYWEVVYDSKIKLKD